MQATASVGKTEASLYAHREKQVVAPRGQYCPRGLHARGHDRGCRREVRLGFLFYSRLLHGGLGEDSWLEGLHGDVGGLVMSGLGSRVG
jgi:hypothetical protein